MAITIKHAKTDNIADWTQADLDAQIAAGNYPAGTVLADIVLPSDWNNNHTITGLGTIATQDASSVAITGGTVNNTSQSKTTITDYESFTPTTAPTYAEGELWYDSTAHALAYYNDVSSATVHLGQDLILKVINNTGSTIANGSPVYVTSTSSGQTYPNIALAKADVAATSAVIGLTNGSIANGAVGYVTAQGGIDGVNTGSFTVGQVLYLSPYSAGQLMNTIPPTGITVQVGIVSYVNSSTGKIYVKQTTPLAVPASIITGTLGVDHGGTGQASALVAGGVMYGSSTTAMGVTAVGTSGQVLTSSGASAPTWTTLTTGTVTSVGISAPSIFTVTNSPVTSSGTLTLTYSGTALPIANGGTNATTAAGANANLQGFTTTATSATPVALTNTSTYYQYFTGTLTQTITLPLNTDIQNGWSFHIANNSTGNLTINSNSGALVNTVLPGTTVHVTCVDATVNTAAAWDSGTTDFATVTGTGSVVLSTSPTLVTPALGTPASGTLTNCTGLLATGGGTGLSTYTTGDTLYSSAANTLSKLAIGTTGQVLSIASGIPAWSSSSSASVFTTGSSQTYTVPAGVTRVKVTIQGPGGNGGASASGRATGGSAGATVIKWLTVTPGDTMTYTVGTASGTNSTVVYSATTYTAASGSNGTSTAYAASLTAGPTGGTGTNGDINITGGRGGNSYGSSTTITTNFSGDGANSQFGQGGKALAFVATAGQNGTGYGSGGSGAIGNATGGTGAGGITIFEPY